MKKDTRKVILQAAFMLFLEKGYDAVSVSMIQDAAGIGRATMYYYFQSKQELFEAVIEMNISNAAKQQEVPKKTLLSHYLKERISKARASIEHSPMPASIGMIHYYIMNFQALEMNPDFAKQGKVIHDKAVDIWKGIIQYSVNRGEIAADTDVDKAARLFMNSRHGVGVTSTPSTSMEENINEIEEMYQYIFTLLKGGKK